MLKISLKQGQYVNIGDNIRVVYVGGTGNHGRLMIDAPKEVKIARSTVEQNPERRKDTYYPEPAISKEAQDEIKKILWNERMKAETKKDAEEDVEPVEGTMTAEEKAKAEEEKQKEEEKKKEVDTQMEVIYQQLEERIKSIVGTKVSIQHKNKNKGKIEIEYYSQEELERLIDLFESIK